ncbi:ABC transporter G family member 34 [Sesamum alatum]|uniref:ABC transporter G family member 34 n=1 Tax=Sesamum alatum TaxID=300844 RepID=A0AAE1YMX1_9LAMI|nr:ABC transporter G family member 34 [Sesamum alatum]
MGFEWTVAKCFWFYYFIFTCFVYFNLFGMMLIALTPGLHVGSIVAGFILSLWNLFSGFLIPKPVSSYFYVFLRRSQDSNSSDHTCNKSGAKRHFWLLSKNFPGLFANKILQYVSKLPSGGGGTTGALPLHGRFTGCSTLKLVGRHLQLRFLELVQCR